MEAAHPADNSAAKTALRDQVRAARKRRPLDAAAAFAAGVAEVAMAWPEVRRAATVAAYVSVGSEPGTGLLLDALLSAGKRVVVPVVRRDRDLDWAVYTGPDDLESAVLGLLEPTGPRLGVDALAAADVVLAPGHAVSSTGDRLGQGGGYYDRYLAAHPQTIAIGMAWDIQEVPELPVELHDMRLSAIVTPTRVLGPFD